MPPARVLRRAYLTFDADFGESWFGRLRFEANQSGEFENYDFEADFKDLYLGRNFGEHRLLVGLSPTPTFDLIEKSVGHALPRAHADGPAGPAQPRNRHRVARAAVGRTAGFLTGSCSAPERSSAPMPATGASS